MVRVGLSLLGLTLSAVAADPVGVGTPWPFDVVQHKNGAVFRGLILNEGVRGIDFQVVRRAVGRPTLTPITFFDRREIASVRRLTPADREVLRQKLAELDPTGDGERHRMEALDITRVDWLGSPNAAERYVSDQFVLTSGASDEVTRRAAVRLEQIYAAFERVLPPRHEAGRPTTVLLAGTTEDYARLVGPTAGPLLNPALYDPVGNRIVCGSDLRRLGDELATARRYHRDQLASLSVYEAEVRKLYQNQPAELRRFLDTVGRERRRVVAADRANSARFDTATSRLFALLYHEAFHSYAATFVYPPLSTADVAAGKGTGELPRWVNEGLAQIFETAVVEAGELRVGHADAARLNRVRELLRGTGGMPPAGLVSVRELLRAGKDAFLAAHADQRNAADRVYLTSWAVTFHLTFERRAVGTAEFDAYLKIVNAGSDPLAAFEAWVGRDVSAYESELRDYLLRLQPDGTMSPAKK